MIFILDNLDSFTYNLYQYFGELGEEVIVRRADECHLEEIEELDPELIVISPGPCTPNEAQLSLEVIAELQGKIPILGVCLGHQAIGQVFGGKVVRAQVPIHGKTSLIRHDNSGVFQNLPNPLEVTRYHSLILERHSLPSELFITAATEQGEIMGIRHCSLPIEGVQFHPEAILTSSGHDILRTAITNARQWLADKSAKPWLVKPLAWDELPNKLPNELLPAQLFPALQSAADPFFLDSGAGYGNLGRYSFMGAFPFLRATATRDKLELVWPDQARKEIHPLTERKSLSWLDELLAKYRLPNLTPFPFAGGAVGYFSYDLKDELEKLGSYALDDLSLPLWRLAWYDGIIIFDHQEHQYWLTACGMNEAGVTSPKLAAARLHRLEALISEYLHTSKHLPAESACSAPDSTYSATDSMHSASNSMRSTPDSTRSFSESACSSPSSIESERNSSPENVIPGIPRAQYLEDLSSVIEYIYAGDIYQANLTQRFALTCTRDPWELYQHLHAHNPAPFAAFLPYEDFQLLSSSPERFLRIDANGLVETRPIKGTRPRKACPAEDQAMADELFTSPKDRAELTMIIDLERNDLGRIAKFGTVQVQELIRLEKYPTVWHLVSTVTAQLRDGIVASEILKAVFPGGSITGAPKIRAMEIIEELEPYKRGVYTGSIGYIGFDGAWDLNIVIRTIILKNGQAYVNVGGGIVADSRPENEYDETLDKAQALFTVLAGVLKTPDTSISQEEV